METPSVFVFSRSGSVADGLALARDGGSVFHIFSPAPDEPPAGRQCHLEVLSVTEPSDEAYQAALAEVTKDPGPTVILFKSSTDGGEEERFERCYVLPETGDPVLADLHYLPSKDELYSRSRGLLEGEILSDQSVSIVGLGSFGSLIAVELAKAGLGGFTLFDFDRLEPSNIARHHCGLSDLGRLKTAAVRDAILEKNPYARVTCHDVNVNEEIALLQEDVAASNLLVAVTDENRSRLNLNEAALETETPGVFGRAITRAAGGDVFRYRPGVGPCLNCVFGVGLFQQDEEISNFDQADRDAPAYVDREDLKAVVQVGLSSDIVPITNFMVKLALVELSRGRESGIASLEEDLVSDFYIWANRRDESYASWPPLDYYFNRNSILRWYGAKVDKDPNCMVCGSPET